MKKIRFMALAIAALSFAACTEEALENERPGTGADGTPAYLTIMFSANASTSTRANTGDDDGDAEDSGHKNAGTEAETSVKTALIVVVPSDGETQGTGFVKYYGNMADENQDGGKSDLTVINDATKTYSPSGPIEIGATDAGIKYKVLVVVNPIQSLINSYVGGDEDIYNGIKDVNTAREIYNTITTGFYTPEQPEQQDTYQTASQKFGNVDNGFMMANKAEASVVVKTENTPENPAQARLDVERVLSKITFRPEMAGENPNYVYKVESTIGNQSFKAETEQGFYDPNDTGADYQQTRDYSKQNTFNKAKDIQGNEVWVLYGNDNTFKGVYGKTSSMTEDLTNFNRLTPRSTEEYAKLQPKEGYYVARPISEGKYDEANSVTLVGEMEDAISSTFYIKLDGYALINLSKNINYVRHTIAEGSLINSPFGTVEANYLWTPYWEEKNAVEFTSEGEFVGSPEINEWFYNTLKDVSDESKGLSYNWTESKYFQEFPEQAEDPGEVTGVIHNNSNPEIGYLLGYCFENSVEADQQRQGLTTGISFVATVWKDENCKNPLDKLYLYAGHNFTSIKEIVDAYAGNVPDDIKKLAVKESTEEITKEDLDKVGIIRYEGNQCYYYTNRIKHFDNGNDSSMGKMEFAIMRNNIYSLAVTKISDIGDPFIDPTPGTEDESQNAALVIEANIIPWIVRYNDIEF